MNRQNNFTQQRFIRFVRLKPHLGLRHIFYLPALRFIQQIKNVA